MTVHSKKFQLEERRRQVASMLAESMTEQEIADKLGVDRTTISRDVTILKKMSQQFVYDLAHSDLAYYYKQCLNGLEEAKRKAWLIFNRLTESSSSGAVKDSLLALKLTVDCNEAQFSLFKEGPAIMQIKWLEERLAHIESRESNQELRKEV
ncbi:MAG: HTH domain-containing protein [Nitrososphaeraceae archaeon]|nr:HTH domain-containing protein [Nitrososphaeraceae archaeon]